VPDLQLQAVAKPVISLFLNIVSRSSSQSSSLLLRLQHTGHVISIQEIGLSSNDFYFTILCAARPHRAASRSDSPIPPRRARFIPDLPRSLRRQQSLPPALRSARPPPHGNLAGPWRDAAPSYALFIRAPFRHHQEEHDRQVLRLSRRRQDRHVPPVPRLVLSQPAWCRHTRFPVAESEGKPVSAPAADRLDSTGRQEQHVAGPEQVARGGDTAAVPAAITACDGVVSNI